MTNTLTSWLPPARPSTDARCRPSLTRLEDRDNPSGGLDPTFSGDGKLTTDFGGVDAARAVAVQPDGKILVAGTTDAGDFAVARYNPDGGLDATFDGDGKQTVDFGADDFATAVTVQADGRILVAGYTSLGASGVNTNNFAVVRLTAAGGLDATLDADGKLTIDYGADDRAAGVAVQPDGKILLAGTQLIGSAADFAFARLNPNGGFDTAFDLDGKVAYPNASEDVLTAVFLQPDGKIVAAGYTDSGGTNDMVVMRLIATGSPDPGFDTDGRQTVNFGGDDRAAGVTVQSDGTIVLAGSSDAAGNSDFAVARLNAGGTLDTAFSGDGKATYTFGSGASGQAEAATGVLSQAGGRLVVTGYTDNDVSGGPNNFAILRLLANGDPDAAFDGDGKLQVDFGGDDRAVGASVQEGGRVLVVGESGSDFAAARLVMGSSTRTDIVGRDRWGNWWLNRTTGTGFNVSGATGWNEAAGWRDVTSADFTGDGRADIAGRTADGSWWVGRSTGTGFINTLWGGWNEAAGWRDVSVGDFTGDGRADIAGRTADGSWWVAASTGTSFVSALWARWNEAANWRDVRVADFNGDGRADVAGRTSGGQWWVGASTGTGFVTTPWTIWNEAAGWRDVRVGDFDGDGRADVAGRTAGGAWFVGTSTGTGFVNTLWAGWNEAAGWRDVRVGDFDGDGRADMAGRTADGSWWVAASTGTGFVSALWANWNEGAGWRDVRVGDYDGDGRADIAGRTSDGSWWVGLGTGAAFATTQWGFWTESAGWKDVMAGPFVG